MATEISPKDIMEKVTDVYQRAFSEIKRLRRERIDIFESMSKKRDEKSINKIRSKIEKI